jgi:hypothetical protein
MALPMGLYGSFADKSPAEVTPVGEATDPFPRSAEALADPEGCPYPRQHVEIDAI